MRNLFWLLAGAILVSVAFVLGGGAEDIWRSLLFAYLAVILFLVAFLANPFNQQRNTTGVAMGLSLLLVISGVYGWLGYQESTKQNDNLKNIRETIETEIAKTHINKMLLQTLKDYTSSAEQSIDMGTLFESRYDSMMTDRQIHYSLGSRDESLQIELAKASADSVVLVAYSAFVPGKQRDFKNYNGTRGHIQTKGILTAKGIEYEREN